MLRLQLVPYVPLCVVPMINEGSAPVRRTESIVDGVAALLRWWCLRRNDAARVDKVPQSGVLLALQTPRSRSALAECRGQIRAKLLVEPVDGHVKRDWQRSRERRLRPQRGEQLAHAAVASPLGDVVE